MITEIDIKQEYSICSRCKGSGSLEETSHDCWGKYESFFRSCFVCGGYGFCISSDLKKKIKTTLGL